MSATAVGQCTHCAAVINRHWPSCLVCHTRISPSRTNLAVPLRNIHPGSTIEWIRADRSIQGAVVDFIHIDTDGVGWAFVALGESWSAVNMQFVTRVERHEPGDRKEIDQK